MAGNANSGRREKPFLEALMMELKAAGKDSKKLREIAKQLIDKAASGDIAAILAFADRMDGKPAQQINHADHEGGPLSVTWLPPVQS